MKTVAATLFVVLAAAGCLQQDENGPDYTAVKGFVDASAAPVLRVDHDDPAGHTNAHLHQGSANMALVGYSNAIDDSGDPDRIPPHATYTEIAVTQQYAYLVAQSSDGSYGGFSIIDHTDPSQPHVVSHFSAQGGADVEVNPEETLAFLSTQRNSVQQLAGGLAAQGTPAAGVGRGIYVVDIADKGAPKLDSFVPLPYNGPHTITFFRHANGNDYLLVCTYDLVADPVTGGIASAVPVTQRLIVYLIQSSPPSPVPGAPVPKVGLFPVAQFQIVQSPPAGKLYFPHDTSVQVHPFQEGRTLIDLAYWDEGLRILDFSNPPPPSAAAPDALPMLAEVGAFTDFAPSAFNNIHFAKAFATPMQVASPDGRLHTAQVTVAEPEIISAPDETGQITFIDTSDPSHPSAVGHWTLPPQNPPLGVSGLNFSPHNFDLWDGKVALGHYHAGVWVIDASSPEHMKDPVEVGFYMTAKPRAASPTMQPDVWGVVQNQGLLYVSDEATGLYILQYTGP
ncbi:MAG: hypothetical protein V4510_08280 [bacterium]